jgi:ATP-dependent RNA helicase DeaD
MLRYLCDTSGVRGNKIGRIDLKGVYSFFEVENDVVDKFVQGFKKAEYNGRSVRIEMSQDGDKRRNGSARPYHRRDGEESRRPGAPRPGFKRRY